MLLLLQTALCPLAELQVEIEGFISPDEDISSVGLR